MHRLLVLLLATHVLAVAPALAATPVSIAFAEQPVRLLRDKHFFLAGRGAQLHDGDILEAGSGSIQIDGGGSATLALGPSSRLHVRLGPKGGDYLLLGGWLKVQARGGAPVALRAPGARMVVADSSLILHVGPGKTALFVETGQPAIDELRPGQPARRANIAREQYAVFDAGQPLKLLPRAPKDFLGAMPRAFFDALVPVASRTAASVPKPERPASFTEIAPWLADQPELRQVLHRRFHPPKRVPANTRRPAPALANDAP